MPRTNVARMAGPERDVATRVALERERHGLSAAALARAMTAVGCPINQSAINKIEQGDPPRRISVDELVAFAKVFDLEVEDLLLPAHAARDNRVVALYKRLEVLQVGIGASSEHCMKVTTELRELVDTDERLASDAAVAVAAYELAFTELTGALAALSQDIAERLRARAPAPRPPTSQLTFRTTSAYEARAAQAAAGVPVRSTRASSPPGKRRPNSGK